MKTSILPKWTVVGATLLTALSITSASATHQTEGKHERSFTGTVTSVDPEQKSFAVQGKVFTKRFTADDSCTFSLANPRPQSFSGVQLGQKVMVAYQSHNGIRVAERVTQTPMHFAGRITEVDPIAHTVTVRHNALDKTFQVGDDCKVKLGDRKATAITDLKPGQTIAVTYESPRHWLMAREITRVSEMPAGSITAR